MEMELLMEGDLRRQIAALAERVEGVSGRVQIVHEEGLKRHGMEGGVRGRVETIEKMVGEMRMLSSASLQDMRVELDKKAGMADFQLAMSRIEALAEENRQLRLSQDRMNAQIGDVGRLQGTMQELTERLVLIKGDFEDTSMALSGDMGEIKGKVEGITSKQVALDLKVGEASHSLRSDMEANIASINAKFETNLSAKCSNLESKLSSKVDTVMIEAKQWRSENAQLQAGLEEKVGGHERVLQKMAQTIDTTLSESIQATQTELRGLVKQVEVQDGARKDLQQSTVRDISELNEKTNGLNEQYETLLNDASQRNEMFGDVMRAMGARVDTTENQLAHWRSMIDAALEDMRGQGIRLVEERISDSLGSIEQLIADREAQKATLEKLEGDAKVTAASLGELDGHIMKDLTDLKDSQAMMKQELEACNAKIATTNGEIENTYFRMAKAVLDTENLARQSSRELQEAQKKTEGEVSEALKGIEFINNSKFPAWESRLTTELKAVKPAAELATEVARLKEGADGYTSRNDFLTLQQEVQRVASVNKEIKLSAERGEMVARGLQTAMEEQREALTTGLTEMESTTVDLTTTLSHTIARLDPAVKRLDSQVAMVQRTMESTQQNIERLESSHQDVSSEQVEMHSRIAGVEGRIETLVARPTASEQSLKALQAQMDSSLMTLQRDMNTMQGHQQEVLDRFTTDASNKTKVIGSAVMELRQKVESLDAKTREESTRSENTVREFRTLIEENHESLGRRVDSTVNDIRNLNSSTQKFEVQINDTKAIGQTLNDLNERFTRTLEELEGATGGIATELSSLKGRVVRTERQVRDNITRDVTELADKVEMKFVQIEDRTNKATSELGSHISELQHSTGEYKRHNDEEKKELREAMSQILQKQEAAESMSSFGIRMVTEIKESFDRFEADQAEQAQKAREELDRRNAATAKGYDEKLSKIFEQEQVEGKIRSQSARHVLDLQEQIRELAKKRSDEASQPPPPPQAAPQHQPQPAKPIAIEAARTMPDAGSIMSSVSSRAEKPAVGMDCKDSGEGLKVYHVKTGGPADIAGVIVGDFITHIQGMTVPSRGVYKNIIKRRAPGDKVPHTLQRKDAPGPVEVVIEMGTARAK